MDNKRQLIYRIVIILVPILVAIASIPIIYAWYVNVIRTGKIDGSTKNVSINYTFDNGRTTSTNSLTYTIDNLAFFDIDNEDETAYFSLMACDLEIHLENTSQSDMTYTVVFQTTKREILDGEDNVISKSYVACYMTNNPTTTIAALKTNGTVSGNSVTYTETTTSFQASTASPEYALKASNSGTTDEATIHLYLIGVQEIDSATNTDFLYSEAGGNRSLTQYTFTITITGTPKSDSIATEVTTTQATTTTTN